MYACVMRSTRALYMRTSREDNGVFFPNHRVNELLKPKAPF